MILISTFSALLFLSLVGIIIWRALNRRKLNKKDIDIDEEDANEAYAKFWKQKQGSAGVAGEEITDRGRLTSQKFVEDSVNSWNEVICSTILLSNSNVDVIYLCYELHIKLYIPFTISSLHSCSSRRKIER